jgi:hypothetical protein
MRVIVKPVGDFKPPGGVAFDAERVVKVEVLKSDGVKSPKCVASPSTGNYQ